MKSRRRRLVVSLLLSVAAVGAQAQPFDGCPSTAIVAAFEDFGKTGRMPPTLGRWLGDREAQRIAPFKAFDDAHFVGVCWVSAWLLPTPQGHFLIDTLHEPHAAELLDNIRKAGFDPQDIRYVLITHGHYDHAGGAARLRRELKNARFVMTETGWAEALASASAAAGKPNAWEMTSRDIVGKEGDTWTLGGRTVTMLETPGHTLGTASYLYDVHDGARAYRVVTVGGLGLNAIQNARQVELYLDSVAKLDAMAASDARPVQVHLTTHPFSTGLMEQRAVLAARTAADPHPLVNAAALHELLQALERGARERLVAERAKARP
ncbi:MAG TPA: MBL fold metallo-hydrolase [Caldimonas sp.]|nr:MBL fold metallo-hydrolase [Caldimonas sp.]